jgi:hypothetical protein
VHKRRSLLGIPSMEGLGLFVLDLLEYVFSGLRIQPK